MENKNNKADPKNIFNIIKMSNAEKNQPGGFCPMTNNRCVESDCALWLHEPGLCSETCKAISLQAANRKSEEIQDSLLCACEAMQNTVSLIVENLKEISESLGELVKFLYKIKR